MKTEYIKQGVIEAKRSKCATRLEVINRLKFIFSDEITTAECYKVWSIIK